MVHPDMRIGLYISNFLCVSTTIVIYSHLSESHPCKAPLYDIKIGSEKVSEICLRNSGSQKYENNSNSPNYIATFYKNAKIC